MNALVHTLRCLMVLLLLAGSASLLAQKEATTKPEKKKDTQKNNANGDEYGWNDKVGFIVGAGTNNALDDIFAPPTIDRQTGFVQLQHARRYRGNMSFGISYTFGEPKEKIREVTISDGAGLRKLQTVKHIPKGFSTSLFISPATFANLGGSNISATTDLGFGLGYREGPFAIYVTAEVFRLSQPRSYFIDRYWNTDQQYTVNGEVQSGIDQSDSSIFTDQIYVALGFKLCYTLDVFKSAAAKFEEAPKLVNAPQR